MHKKLTKYIESYEIIDDEKLYELKPNGGMIVLINHNNSCEIIIEDTLFELKKDQSILINAYTESVEIRSTEKLNLVAVRFKGAAASFFYEDLMEQLMYNPTEPIYLVESVNDIELDDYFLNCFTPSKLPFNIMKIIDLLDNQGSDYNIDEVLAIANVPRKILDKLFRLHAGLTFKTYAMIKDKS